MKIQFCLCLTVLAMPGWPAIAAVLHVPSEHPTIQAGIDAAAPGDIVQVADGIYTGDGNRDIDFSGKPIVVKSTAGPDSCIIDCQSSHFDPHRGFCFCNGEDENSVIMGFTIRNGSSDDEGGAISCHHASPTIIDCTFTSNQTIGLVTGGGAIYFENSSSLILNCTFYANRSERALAAFGGAVFCRHSTPMFRNCNFSANSTFGIAANRGGGIACDYSDAIIADCVFTENRAGDGGGAIGFLGSSPHLTNCIVVQNKASRGGGIYCIDSFPYLMNCTLAMNTGSLEGGAIWTSVSTVSIANSIVRLNSPSQFNDRNQMSIIYSNIQGGDPGRGNLDVDPVFSRHCPPDFHLLPGSPCIDSGTPEGSPASDLDGNPRPSGIGVDMGAYEFSWPNVTMAYITMPSHSFQPGDRAGCNAFIWNPYDYACDEYKFFAVMDIWGTFYCAPSYNMIDYYSINCNPGLTEIQIIPDFTWPSDIGSTSGITWYAALVNPEMDEAVSGIGMFDFGWSE